MVTVRGKSEVRAYMAAIPDRMNKLLRAAGREGAKIVADEIKANTPSDEVRDNVRIRSTVRDELISVKIDVAPGWARSVGIWLEWGTRGHFISVADDQRGGRSIGRINEQVRDAKGNASLVIGGKFVGATVWHPGADSHPTFRPAIDTKGRDAIAAAQAYINVRVSRRGVADVAEGDDA